MRCSHEVQPCHVWLVVQWPGGDEANKADTRRASGWRRAGRRCRRAVVWRRRACSGWGPRHLVWVQVEEAGGDHRRSLVVWVVSKQSGLTVPRMVALVRKQGATRQRGLKLRLRDLGKIWVSGFGPWEPAAAKQHLTLSKGRTRHPQPLQPPFFLPTLLFAQKPQQTQKSD